MRIIVTNHFSDRRGGVETYIERLLVALVDDGHEVFAVFDLECRPEWPHISVPGGVETRIVAKVGLESAIREINGLDRSVVLANSFDSPLLPAHRLIELPVEFFVHVYHATCITGLRINRRPFPHPCDKVFGPSCLASYFPRRCGGRNPLTMVKLYKQEVAHQKQLADFEVVIANSDAVRLQLKSVGIEAETLHPFIDADLGAPRSSFRHEDRRSLGFLGRFEDYKGGATLLAALPRVVECSNVALRVTMSGDGSQREMWTRLAAEISARDSRISVDFTGWLAGDRIDEVFRSIDVLVIPSVWPEPFGLVGLEAARRGLPVVAFDVGGISEWLVDRENGQLVAGERCAADDLADAIVRCIKDVGHYSQLSTGAVRRRTAFSVDAHVRRLVGLLEGIQRT